jgi:hypothetical protein
MKKLLRSLAAVAVTTVAIGLAVGFAGSASAAGNPPWEPVSNPPQVGGLTFYNAAGQVITGGSVNDSPIAAYVQGSNTIRAGDTKATLYGVLPVNGQTPGQWSGIDQLGASTTFPDSAAPAPLNVSTLPVETGASGDETVAQLEADFPNTDTSSDGYAGIYVLRLRTGGTDLSTTTSYDSADIQISGSTWSVVYTPQTATNTTLVATPTSPQQSGTSVTLTATVNAPAPGTVQFEVGSTDIGSPVAVSDGASNATASTTTTTLPVGAPDNLSAVFTPTTGAAFAGSTGTTTYTITAAPAIGTTTALGVNPTTAAADTTVSLTANVSNTATSDALGAVGNIDFYDNGSSTSDTITSGSTLLGTVPLGSGGVATLPYSSFAQGAHNIVAEFLPTSPSTYDSSISQVVLFTATAPTYAPDPQTVEVGIPAGTLTITTPYDPANPFQLGTATLDADGQAFHASAPFGSTGDPANGVTITDTRAGDLPWTASAEVNNFTDGATPPDVINGQNLAFTGVTASYIAGNALQSPNVTTTDVTSAGSYGPAASGSDGRGGDQHQFAAATAGAGSVYIDGTLTLTAPSSTPAGTYTATLTFTIA